MASQWECRTAERLPNVVDEACNSAFCASYALIDRFTFSDAPERGNGGPPATVIRVRHDDNRIGSHVAISPFELTTAAVLVLPSPAR